MPLDEDSSYLTTFNTPFGRYRFTVVLFGVTFAQEVFHRTVHEQFRDLPGYETDIDDIFIWGRTIEEHDRNLERVLNRVAEINIYDTWSRQVPNSPNRNNILRGNINTNRRKTRQ